MNEDKAVKDHIRCFLVQKFPAAKKRALQDDVPLLESGIVDSLGILDVVSFLETTFRIQVTDDELTPDNFKDLNSLAAFVDRKATGIEVSAQ